MLKQKNLNLIILIFVALFIKIFSLFPNAVEQYYTNGIYPYVSQTQRILFGWLPFSIGDICYLVVSIILIKNIFGFFKAVFKKRVTKQLLAGAAKQVGFIVLVIYVLFNTLWGLNYNRISMALQLNLTVERYSTENLSSLVQVLIDKVNTFDSTARMYRIELNHKKTLFGEAIDSYSATTKRYPCFEYRFPSIKPSLFSYLGNYMGYTGYYNPFSGEAQANTTVPAFVQPFTACHEIGHQLGYAKENEANFAGFLAARASGNPAFQYSVYFDMYSYAIRELYRRDSLLVKGYKKQLNPYVIQDLEHIRQFYKKYDNPIEPVIRKLYGQYLKANAQPEGLRSYNEVVAMLVAYFMKYGEV